MSVTDLWTPIKDVATCFWGCTTSNIEYIRDLEKNLESLRYLVYDLNGKNEDVGEAIKIGGGLQLKNKNEVKAWQQRAQDRGKKAEKILEKGDLLLKKKQGCCSKLCHCFFKYKLGVTVSEEIDEVKGVIDDRRNFQLDFVLPPNALVDKLDVKPTVGSDSTFEKVWEYIEDPSVGMIAIYGMGGVGKTTLLKKINNKFLDAHHGFDAVIWVVVSENEGLGKVQEAVRSKLNIVNELWEGKNEDSRAAYIRRILETKKFLLLLDDQRNQLELLKAGVPLLDNTVAGSKVVFTTRSEDVIGKVKDVCGRTKTMKRIKVECLTSEDSLQLFAMNFDYDIFADEEVAKHAKDVVEECKGLPLALITIGRAMASKRDSEAWQHAVTQLRGYPTQFPGEGFIKDFGNIHQARNHGVDIIENLKLACLLESCESKDHIKMHDVLRDMASWLICDEGENQQKVLMQRDPEWIRAQGLAKWRKALAISLWGPYFKDLQTETEFSRCQTLIVRETKLRKLPRGFFFNALQVLDLSHNQNLTELPVEIKNLIRLQHLDISYTDIKELPIEVKFLSNLKILLMNDTKKLELLPPDVIPHLSSLQVFSKVKSPFFKEAALLEELNRLEKLICLGITLRTMNSINYLLNSPELQRLIFYLTVTECHGLPLLNISAMQHLETLEIRACHSLEEIKIFPDQLTLTMQDCFSNLSHVAFQDCPVKNVTWLIYARRLQTLELDDCHSIAGVIGDRFDLTEIDETQPIFSNLKHLSLRYLPMLQTICSRVLPFPHLTTIEVYDCPNLRKLPFDSSSARNCLKEIRGEESWWNGLNWDDPQLRKVFTPKFVK
ncbi:probable disease resistance protein At1g61300 isoform X2 [Manihot esculenta]|uniref:Uncharacterized protein n=4 Tax=Manihot esculenta TaxID=3983 RepID=A0ACB7GUC8_MANES|nr:probable disease resistance protein At1g61300 isoform X2 [Manihot esculenta]KAG8643572.1 hypothetical protein MANES_11G052150v8 [Manihot esculenta]KAG8643573.1 hypothetical protein MANES_11G052150v8 [Manihot esculenta]KAG8643574.1 hypothetical protein MANES_11G052150v8 [Manihot esculenta]KAG8643575.1 hypothetical protein MANES_11G052150v8 [Manihot esculenta]